MSKDDKGKKGRIVKCLKLLIEQPFRFKRSDIVERLGVGDKTVRRYLDELTAEGFEVIVEQKRYGLQPSSRLYEALEELLYFREEERTLLLNALDAYTRDYNASRRLKPKLEALYDFQRLGHDFLRRPYLERLDALRQAGKRKCVALLRDYRSSNSNSVRDREVEPFLVSEKEDMLYAFDLDRMAVRHFRLSRIGRVVLLPEIAWAHEAQHVEARCDPFYIVSDAQVHVSFEMSILAYNELVERYPLARSCAEVSNGGDSYHFEGQVNGAFLGLSSFLLGFYSELKAIYSPDSLKSHIASELERMQAKIQDW